MDIKIAGISSVQHIIWREATGFTTVSKQGKSHASTKQIFVVRVTDDFDWFNLNTIGSISEAKNHMDRKVKHPPKELWKT